MQSERANVLAELRRRIRTIEQPGVAANEAAPLGVPQVDAALPWGGVPRAGLEARALP
ncbi:hypothetical protein [Ferruginivarius sediminum]|uniref:hypothetical protein n=1 Tax=Ferruginivarius sediminum TaxID=2661937 RepID=UPI001292CD5C|nr:hypothetical protein [Ferruginivarius sediminum]